MKVFFRLLRHCCRWLGYGSLLLTCGWFSGWVVLPALLPAVLPAVASQFGVQIESVSREKSGRWKLAGLQFTQSSLMIGAAVVELPSLPYYLLQCWRGRFSIATRVEVKSLSLLQTAVAERPFQLADFLLDLRAGWLITDGWLPPLAVDVVSVELAEQKKIKITELQLDSAYFQANVCDDSGWGAFECRGQLQSLDLWSLVLSAPSFQLQLQTRFLAAGVELEAVFAADGGLVQAQAHFMRGERLPAHANVFSGSFNLSLGQLGLDAPELKALQLKQLQATWDGQHYQGTVQCSGVYLAPTTGAWPALATLAFEGDFSRLSLQTLQASLGRCKLSLAAPLEFNLATRQLVHAAELKLSLDLSQPPHSGPLGGQFSGRLVLQPDLEAGLNVSYELMGAAVQYAGRRLSDLHLRGHLKDRLLSGHLQAQALHIGPAEPLKFSGDYSWSLAAGDFTLAGQLSSAHAKISGDCHGRWLNGALQLQVPNLLGQSSAPDARFEAALKLELSALQPHFLGSGSLDIRAGQANGLPLKFYSQLTLNDDGLGLNQIGVSFDSLPLLSGQLHWPIKFTIPRRGQPWHQRSEADLLNGFIRAASLPEFDQWLEAAAGVVIEQVELDLALGGRHSQPRAEFSLSAGGIDVASESPAPQIRGLQLSGAISRQSIQVEQFGLELNQSAVRGAGTIELSALRRFIQNDSAGLEKWLQLGSGWLKLERWELSDWAAYLPPLLRPVGELDGQLTLLPDGNLAGQLGFQALSLKPTPHFHALESIQGQLSLFGRQLQLDSFSALLGGRALQVAGQLEFSDWEQPSWDFRLRGEDVPLLRSSNMILRSDLDLRAYNLPDGQPPSLVGQLDFGPSTLLLDFDPWVARVDVGTTRQPPYFSIQSPFFADWIFDLKLQGDSFMQVRNPYFRAELSADFSLSDSFAEPLLLGSVQIASGEFRFPGARMDLEQGEAYIDLSQPHVVQLDFSGSTQTASYVIGMEVLGSLAAPLVQFQSSPVLSNAQIIRLLATGSFTGGAGTVGLYLGQGLLGASGLQRNFMDRFKLNFGNAKTRSGRSTLDVRYQLSEDWYFKGGYDEYDAYNLDLIWSVFRQ